MTWLEAARAVGVSSRTLQRWCAADPDLDARAREARATADDAVEAVTYANCLDPDSAHNTLRTFWLKARRPEVYGDRHRHDLHFATMSDRDLLDFLQAGDGGGGAAGPDAPAEAAGR